jgi:hypothetical protein
MKFRIPEIFLGVFLAVAVFAMGALLQSTGRTPFQLPPAASTDNEKGDHQLNSAVLGWLIHDAAGFFTFCLFIIGGGQIVLFYWQLHFMRQGMKDAESAALAARQSADTAKEAFTKLERPYLFITLGEPPILLCPRTGHPMGTVLARYEITNHGKTPAIVEILSAQISRGDHPEFPLQVDYDNPILATRIIGPQSAGKAEVIAPDNADFDLVRDDLDSIMGRGRSEPPPYYAVNISDGTADAFVWVVVTYQGPFSEGHETSACWRYDHRTKRLIQHGHQEYNYVK